MLESHEGCAQNRNNDNQASVGKFANTADNLNAPTDLEGTNAQRCSGAKERGNDGKHVNQPPRNPFGLALPKQDGKN